MNDQDLANRFGVHRLSIWRWARTLDDFPKPRKIGANTTRWARDEIEAYDEKRKLQAAG